MSTNTYSVSAQPGGSLMYVSRIGNHAAAYWPYSGFTVFGLMDAGEFRVTPGSKKSKHYSSQKSAEVAIRKWISQETRSGANRAGNNRNRSGGVGGVEYVVQALLGGRIYMEYSYPSLEEASEVYDAWSNNRHGEYTSVRIITSDGELVKRSNVR